MKKTALASTFLLCAGLFVATLIVLIKPLTVYAATCTAQCQTGSVSCTGNECSATDGVGCKYTSGGKVQEKKCDVAEELILE
jgi:hypothetical protein